VVIWLRAQDKDAAAQQVHTSPVSKMKTNNVATSTVANLGSIGAVNVPSEVLGEVNGERAGEISLIEQQINFEQENEMAQTTMMDCLMPDDDLLWEGMDMWLTEDLQFGAPLDDSFDRMAQ